MVDEDGDAAGDIENSLRLTQGVSSIEDFDNPERYTQGLSSVEDLETPQRVLQGVSSDGNLVTPLRVLQGVSSDGDFETPVKMSQGVLPTLEIGTEFEDVRSYRKALVSFAIAENFALKFINNESRRVTAKCRAEGCTFRIHASHVCDLKKFRVRTMNPSHTCKGLLNESHPQAQTYWIADKIKQHLKDNPQYKPRDIVRDIHREYGVQIRYTQAWRGKELAMEDIHGSYEYAYRMLPSYCQMLIDANPGTVANLEVHEEDKSFKRLFVAFHATISGFLQGCRPFITLDETLLKTKYRGGHLLAAITMDADGVMFPVAFNISVSDDTESWEWFLTQLREVLFCPQTHRLTFISDRQKGLQPVLETIFPNDFHVFCVGSLAKSFNNDLKNGELTKYFWKVARAETLLEFDSQMAELRAVSKKAEAWIEGIPPKFWAAPHVEGMRYNHLSSKLLESFHDWIEESCYLPIVKFVENIHMKLMKHLNERRELGLQWTSKLVPSADEKIKRRIVKARSFRIFHSSSNQYEVLSDKVDEVNLERRECTCQRWKLSGLPCCHALAAIHAKQDAFADYCSPYFNVETYRSAFLETIHPIPDRTTQPEVQDFVVNLPSIHRSNGKPKKKRIKTGKSDVRPVHCKHCGGIGHNRQTCKERA
ncbi:uncharacterized protein LOC18439216 isoform X2 [Amborella trichopoda]|nr:uncharacterized protein LOC18439216 isoform X2 [Amborella trichopoda]|eukprot:XP_020526090.1 uncharacterized protein LOC18439216 isoform X2 [Amborella trichopoda]